MVKGILGEKIGMLQIWDENGSQVPVTAIKAGPCPIIQIKNQEKDGYVATQIGFNESKASKLSKAEVGHQKNIKNDKTKAFSKITEIDSHFQDKSVGDFITCELFEPGEKVFARGIGKGKGFQGVVKRYGFHGGRKTHGSHFHRSPGAVGAGTDPGRVAKGKKMPGRMGGKKVTVKNLKIVKVDKEQDMIFIKGAVPGRNGGLVLLYQN